MCDTFFSRLDRMIAEKAGGQWTVFAKRAGIPHGTFKAYLNDRLPTAENLVKIAIAYGVSIDWLLLGKETQTQTDANTAQLMLMAEAVLKSRHPKYASALESNIEAFYYGMLKDNPQGAPMGEATGREQVRPPVKAI